MSVETHLYPTIIATRSEIERMSVERLSEGGRRIVRHALDNARYDKILLNFRRHDDADAALDALR